MTGASLNAQDRATRLHTDRPWSGTIRPEHGIAAEAGRAAIWEIDARTGAHRVFASGLRNPVGMAWDPETGALWASVNERDELGGDLVPDYLTSVREGGFYGWPYSYFGSHPDPRMKAHGREAVAQAIVPDYALGPHTASLGLVASRGAPLDVLTGFVTQNGDAMGRPVGVAIDRQGALLVADDMGNTVWRVTSSESRER